MMGSNDSPLGCRRAFAWIAAAGFILGAGSVRAAKDDRSKRQDLPPTQSPAQRPAQPQAQPGQTQTPPPDQPQVAPGQPAPAAPRPGEPLPSMEPDYDPYRLGPDGRPLPPQLQRDYQLPDPRLPWGYRQPRDPYSDRWDYHGYYLGPYYGTGPQPYGQAPAYPPSRDGLGYGWDYGYGNYYRPYPPRDGYSQDRYGYAYEDAYRRGVEDGRRFMQFERQAELGLASYLQAMEAGLTAFTGADYSAAARSFALAARLNQGDAASRIHAAHALFALGRYHDAVPLLRRAFDLQPRIAYFAVDMREDYGDRADFDKHLAALVRACDANPEDADLKLLLGYCRHYGGDPAGAARSLDEAAELRAGDRLIELLRGVAGMSSPATP